MCSCNRLAVMEVGEPGELPLMKELTALKKSKPKKSPLLEGVSPPTQEVVSMQPLEPQGMPIREHLEKEYSQEYAFRGARDASHVNTDVGRDHGAEGTSGRNIKSPHTTPRHFDPALVRSPDFNSKIINWDVSGDPSRYAGSKSKAPPDFLQRESLRNHLEKLGIIGEVSGSDKLTMKATSLLHNWRNAIDDGQSYSIHNAEDFKLEPSTHPWNPRECVHNRTSAKNHTGDCLVYEDEQREREASVMQKVLSRPAKDDRLWRLNTQVLSPLVLNPHDDNHTLSHAKQSVFSLDQKHPIDDDDDDYDYDVEEHDMAENLVQQGKFMYQKEVSEAGINGGLRSFSPLQLHRKQVAPKSTRLSEMYSPHFASLQGAQPGTSETEFFEYDVQALEQPSMRKESEKSYQRASHYRHTPENGRSMKSMRGMSSSAHPRRPILRHPEFKSASGYAFMSPEMEPLPLLTELEDYNGSDEYGGSSNDGGFGEFSSMSELQAGEPDLRASKKNYHNIAERLVKSGDADRQLQLAVRECQELALCGSFPRNLCQKYRPKAFEEVVGQAIVTQALSNAILKGRIAPVYLFQGSRGTGKTSVARIFASALLCVSSEGRQPCGACRECISVATNKSSEVKEVDAASNNGIERFKALLEETICAPPLSRYKVFIVDECHMLTTETWNALLKVLEEPPMNVVFILITTDADQLPRTALSRCQKFPFPKIKDAEIVKRLQKLSGMENLSIDLEILQLIASRSDGSLRDAETTLDQITLLGQQVNPSTLHELVGCASDERMLGLLDAALVADTVNIVRVARELVNSGVEPLSLMSRLATLITDILAGSFKFIENQRRGFFHKQPFSEEKLERLRRAMKILSEGEKQLRVSNDRTTWLIAALLQLGPDRMSMFSASCVETSVTQSPVALDDTSKNEANDFDHRSTERQAMWADHDTNHSQEFSSKFAPTSDGKAARHTNIVYAHETSYLTEEISQEHPQVKGQYGFKEKEASHRSERSQLEDDPLDISFKDPTNEQRLSPTKLDDIWGKVIDRCWSCPLRQLLHESVRLTSISITEVDATIHLEVGHPAHKSSCERSHKNIALLFEMVLGFPVDIKIILASSLPAEGAEHVRTQGSAVNHVHIYPDSAAREGHDWPRAKETATKSRIPLQSHATDSFPAIPPRAPSVQRQKCVASAWKNGGKWPEHQNDTHKVETVVLIQEPRGSSPMTTIAPGGAITYRAQDKHAVVDTNGYKHSQIYDAINSEEERIMDEDEDISPNSFEVTDQHDKIRHKYEGSKGTQAPHSIDGRKSCDAKVKKGGNSKVVRHFPTRNPARSPPKSDPNSPVERGSHLKVPRFSIKSHTNSQKNKDSESLKEASEQLADPEEATAGLTHKKGLLKGAAGSFARLFQGKLSK